MPCQTLASSVFTPFEAEHYTPSVFRTLCTETLCTGVMSSIHLGSLDTKILYLELFQKFFLYPSEILSSSIEFHLQPCSKGSGLHQAPHVCVNPWVSFELVQGLLSFSHMILPIMCFCNGCKCLFIVYASCYESCLVSHDVSIYCMMEL